MSTITWNNKQQIADHIGVTRRTVNTLMAKRILPFTKCTSRLVRFDVAAVDAALAKFSVNGK